MLLRRKCWLMIMWKEGPALVDLVAIVHRRQNAIAALHSKEGGIFARSGSRKRCKDVTHGSKQKQAEPPVPVAFVVAIDRRGKMSNGRGMRRPKISVLIFNCRIIVYSGHDE